MATKTYQQPWIGKPVFDFLFILLPPFLSLGVIVLFPRLFQDDAHMPDIGWLVLVLLIDVAHVYSTLFRTYFDPAELGKRSTLMKAIPFIGFVLGVVAYSISSLLFWRLLAYTAVFHFIRQQYGFMRVYSRSEAVASWESWIDTICIYTATLYPIVYWHLSGPRNFNWFVSGDFIYLQSAGLLKLAAAFYWLTVVCFILKELRGAWLRKKVNLPKLLIILGTLVSWYFGIVYYNGDMAYTLLNVVSHGIPYMALIWIYGEKNYTGKRKGSRFLQMVFSRRGVILFIGIICLLAFLEEGLWDILVWKEHSRIFQTTGFASLQLSDRLLSFIVPLLALPQITHYILDGFIWKVKKDDFKWSSESKPSETPTVHKEPVLSDQLS